MAAMCDTKRKGRLTLEEETDSQLTPQDKGGLIKPQDYSRCFATYYIIFQGECVSSILEDLLNTKKKMPRIKPLSEAVEQMARNQAADPSLLNTPHIIPYFATGLQGGKSKQSGRPPASPSGP